MTELLTAAQMRAIEQAAIASGEVTGLELMERAGRGVVDAILVWRPELATAPHRAVVLCGPGNNGGDGFVVARLLHQRGWEVEVFLYGDEAKLPPDAAENARRWQEMGAIRQWPSEWSLDSPGSRHPRFGAQAIYIDALFGTGLTRPLDEEAFSGLCGELAESNRNVVQIVAVDCPSGLCLDSGKILGATDASVDPPHFEADLTVTFHGAKIGHYCAAGPETCHAVEIADIGLTSHPGNAQTGPRLIDVRPRRGIDYRQGSALDKNCSTPPAQTIRREHKYDHGHALILSGGVGKGGAARLAARGALRIGAGLVTVGCPPAALLEHACQLNAAMVFAVGDPADLPREMERRALNAVCLGPGLGLGDHTRTLVRTVLGTGAGVVLDADAITEFRKDPEALFPLLHDKCVLTPHEGEFGRLFPDLLAKLKEPATNGPAYSKVDAVRAAAKRAGCTVLFKGADTVIADPSGRSAINSAHCERAAPWLATAGSGDVLAGFITGLLARGFAPMQAAETAAWLHVECARRFGPGLIAEDLPEQLPAVFRDLGL